MVTIFLIGNTYK